MVFWCFLGVSYRNIGQNWVNLNVILTLACFRRRYSGEKDKSSCSHVFFKIDFLEDFAIFTGKYLCWSVFFFIKLHAWKSATLFKRDSSTGVFLWIFRSFQEQLFWQNTSGCYVWKDGMKLSIIIVQPFNAWWPLKGHTFLNKSTAESMYDL